MRYIKSPMKMALCVTAWLILGFLRASPALGQEVYFLGGFGNNSRTGETPFMWEGSYAEQLSRHFEWSFSFMNEGHIKYHHRDGVTPQLWVRSFPFHNRLFISAGAGPYLYFDTNSSNGPGHDDDHGFGGVFSVSATWLAPGGLLLQFRGNEVFTGDSFDTRSILFGIGYQLAPPSSCRPLESLPALMTQKNELTVFAGTTILNSFESEDSPAGQIEYRRSILPFIAWSIGWLYEGTPGPINRTGVTTQIWPTRSFFGNRLSLGMGVGGYFAVDDEKDGPLTAGLLSFTVAYRLNPRFLARLTWSRTITGYDCDTDILLIGLGYVW